MPKIYYGFGQVHEPLVVHIFVIKLLITTTVTAGLLVFGTSCFFIAKRVYGIV